MQNPMKSTPPDFFLASPLIKHYNPVYKLRLYITLKEHFLSVFFHTVSKAEGTFSPYFSPNRCSYLITNGISVGGELHLTRNNLSQSSGRELSFPFSTQSLFCLPPQMASLWVRKCVSLATKCPSLLGEN